jgi:hypothetical protein
MTIEEVIKILENRLRALNSRLAVLLVEGELCQFENLSNEITQTQETLDSLKRVA